MPYIKGRYHAPDTKLTRPSLPRSKRPKACCKCGVYLDDVRLPYEPERCIRCADPT